MQLQVGVKIFLQNSDGKYLLLRRSLEKYPNVQGEWDIVGGRIDPGASLMDNLQREVHEETQLAIIGEPKLIAAQDIIPNNEKHVVRLSYVGRADGEPVLDTTENVAYRWVTAEELTVHENLDIYVKELVVKGLL